MTPEDIQATIAALQAFNRDPSGTNALTLRDSINTLLGDR